MKAIVTGANGFIGSSLVEKLVDNGVEVLAVDISFCCKHLPESSKIIFREISAENIFDLEETIEYGEYDCLYNLAWRGVNGIDKSNYEVQLNNIMLALKYAELAKAIGCKKYLCAGTIAERAVESLENIEIASGGMMYGSAKYCCHTMLETYCKNISLDFVWMQFSNIYGPSNKTGNIISYTLDKLNNNLSATFGPASQPYDFIYIDDLIEAIFRLGIKQTNQNFYFIGSGTPMILSDYLRIIGNICEKSDLIKIGERDDDNIKYSYDMFDTTYLKTDIGEYISASFDEHIKFTIAHYQE